MINQLKLDSRLRGNDKITCLRHLRLLIILTALSTIWPTYAVPLANTPLFLGAQIPPNVMFLMDDSGSMDWEIMAKKHWFRCSYDPTPDGGFRSYDCGRYDNSGFVFMRNGTYGRDRMSYLYQNADNSYGNCGPSYSWSPSCDNRSDWRLYSNDLNVIMYNPEEIYTPWRGPCLLDDTICTAASFSAARSNPREGETGYSITRNLSGFSYHVWVDDKGYNGSRPRRGANNNHNTTPNNIVDYWDSFLKITFNDQNTVTLTKVIFNPNTSGLHQTSTTLGTLTSSSACYSVLGSKLFARFVHQESLPYNSENAPGCKTIPEATQNIANWYQYARKRSYTAKAALSDVVQNSPSMRYALTLLKNQDRLFTEVPTDTNHQEHNTNLLASMYSYNWVPANTPLRNGMYQVGKYFDGELDNKANPITQACQQNFAIVLTDGQWNGSLDAPEFSDSDGDGFSNTFADIAHYYYHKDLSDLPNEVAGNARDPIHTQHLVTFGATFGLSGNLADTNNDGWPDPALTDSSNWGNPHLNEAARIDDVWHGAYNSRGTYVAAQSPQAVSIELNSILSDIKTRIASSASVAQNSSIITEDAYVYQTRFNSADWRGHLLAFAISDSGLALNATWDAGCLLTGGRCLTASSQGSGRTFDDRHIITYDHTEHAGTPFRNHFLSSSQVDALLSDVTLDRNRAISNRINYIRGATSKEIRNGGEFRNRESILGDFMNSSPIYVGPPNRRYPDDLEAANYSTFRSTYANRPNMIYVGANDGMLHAFDADTGAERLGYIPGFDEFMGNLRYLFDPNYFHRYYVDGSPAVADAYFDNAWHSVLAGTLNAGGRGLFILDVTDPLNFEEERANSIAIAEFTNEDDDRLGYTFSKPQIAKMNDGRWAVIIGNGYNSGNEQASLIILFLDGARDGTWSLGTDYIIIEVGVAGIDNGLATPALADTNGDYKVDTIYAGDLSGAFWRFDVSGNAPADWSATKLFDAGESITSQAVVGRHPSNEGALVYVGTGRYLSNSDNAQNNQNTQSFYGLWDKGASSTISTANLLSQSILGTVNVNNLSLRVTSNNAIDWAIHDGWKMSLIDNTIGQNLGERSISTPILRNGRIIFTTAIPYTSQCSFGGTSWIMELDAYAGSRLSTTPFDINNDLSFDMNDLISTSDIGDGTLGQVFASGLQSSVGITAKPTVLTTKGRTREVKVISGSGGLDTFNENPGDLNLGRQSWKRLR